MERIFSLLRAEKLQTRLLLAFLIVVIPTAILIGVSSGYVGLRGGEVRIINQLESVATVKGETIATWVNTLHNSLAVKVPTLVVRDAVETLLRDPEPTEEHEKIALLQEHLEWMREQSGVFEEVFLMDSKARVIVSTDIVTEGKIFINQPFFSAGMEKPYISAPFYSPTLRRLSIIATQPLMDEQGVVYGVIAGRASADRLSEIMLEETGLGETGQTYLVGQNHGLLTSTRDVIVTQDEAVYVRHEGITHALIQRTNIAGSFENAADEEIIGVYHWLPDLQLILVAEQDREEAFATTFTILRIIVAVTLSSIVVAVVASVFVSRSIASPLRTMGMVATRMEEQDFSLDDLSELDAVGKRHDEIGRLARVFHGMGEVVFARQQKLQQQVQTLTIEVDNVKSERRVREIMETDFFKGLEESGELMRERRQRRRQRRTQK